MNKIKIIIVDDHVLFREGLASIIRQEADFEVVSLIGTVQEAVDITLKLKPDIILMDFNLPDGTGVEATRMILQDCPDCKIVFMTMSERDQDLMAAIRSGAVGYLLKNMTPSKLVESLRAVQEGESALSRSMTLKVMKELSRTKEPELTGDRALGKLTHREKDILVEIAAGKSNLEISQKLCISGNTVKYHVHSILEKLNLEDRKEAARFAREHEISKSG
jgi:two-component system, NarL family, nitrate/nitrite response regulator NarL